MPVPVPVHVSAWVLIIVVRASQGFPILALFNIPSSLGVLILGYFLLQLHLDSYGERYYLPSFLFSLLLLDTA
eukprot:COSAG06_NODE_4627_length_4088_cov_146.121835_4_plen_73_part_00